MRCPSYQGIHIPVFDMENYINSGDLVSFDLTQQVIDHFDNNVATILVIKKYLIESESLLRMSLFFSILADSYGM